MSDDQQVVVQPEVSAPTTDPPTDQPQGADRVPTFVGEFDPERAARLVANLRADLGRSETELQSLRAQVAKSAEPDADLQARLAALEDRARTAEHEVAVARVVQAAGLPAELAEFLTAGTTEGLTEQADKLLAIIRGTQPPPRSPRAVLRPGQAPEDQDSAFDPKALAAEIRKHA